MAVAPVAPGSPDQSGAPRPDPGEWVVQAGDTLGGIARQLQREGMPGTTAELVSTLTRLNGLSNPDRIEVGQVLALPIRSSAPCPAEDSMVQVRGKPARLPEGPLFNAAERQALLHGALLRLIGRASADGPNEHPRAPDGTLLFRQADPAWATERLGAAEDGPTLGRAGCAVTACAMALSRMGGIVLTPGELVRYLRQSAGFQGSLLDWSVAGSAVPGSPRGCPGDLDRRRLEEELDAGRPVVLRVVHDAQGRSQQHWVCLTGRDPTTGRYTANDPATGHTTVLVRAQDGALASAIGEPVHYASDGRMVTFSTRPVRS